MKISTLFPALKFKNYRISWITEWISLIGFWLQLTALQWYVYELTDSAFLLGLFSAMEYVPSLLFTLPAGVWVDHHNKRKILIGTQIMYIILAAVFGAVVSNGKADYITILLFALLFGSVDAVDAPARLSFLPELVDTRALHSAISLNSANFNITRMIGPVLAAVLLSHFSYGGVFYLYALSLIPVTIAYFFIDVNSVVPKQIETHPWKELKSGLLLAKNNKIILGNMMVFAIVCALVVNFGTYGPLFADRVLHTGLNGFGTILFAIGLGSLIAGLISGAARQNVSQSLIYVFAVISSALLMVISLVDQEAPALVLFGFLGFMLILFAINCTTAVQSAVPQSYQGRIMGVYNFVTMGAAPFGNLLVSGIIECIGVSNGLMCIGFLSCILIAVTTYFVRDK